MTTNMTTRHLLKFLVLIFSAVVALATSCTSGQQTAASSTPSVPVTAAASPTSTSPVAQTPAPPPSTKPVPVHAGTIAFVREVSGIGGIYAIHTDGTALAKLAERTCTNLEHPAWSPDGTKIAYHCGFMEITTYSVWAMDSDGSNKIQLTQRPPPGAVWPSWSPDGAHIVFSVYADDNGDTFHIHVMAADGSNMRPLTSGDRYDLLPTWSSNGTILFLRTEKDNTGGDVFAVSPDGSGLMQLTNIGHVNGYALSPDGRKLAFSDYKSPARIMLLPTGNSGSPVTLVNTDISCVFVALAWSPDGQALTMGCSDNAMSTGSKIYIINADGSGRTTVPNTGSAFDPVWAPK